MGYDPVERARREKVRYHKNKQEFLNNGGVMPSDIKRQKSKEEVDGYNIPTKNKSISIIPSANPFHFPTYTLPKPKPVFNKNGLQKKKNDSEYADDADDETEKSEPVNKHSGFRFY